MEGCSGDVPYKTEIIPHAANHGSPVTPVSCAHLSRTTAWSGHDLEATARALLLVQYQLNIHTTSVLLRLGPLRGMLDLRIPH